MQQKLSVAVPRILLGLIYFVFGLNFFLHFIPQNGPQPQGAAAAFAGGLFQAGYFFPFLKTIEVIFGLLLILGWFTPLALVILMPISIHILLFHAILAPSGFTVGLALLIFALNLFLAWPYRSAYAPLFKRK